MSPTKLATYLIAGLVLTFAVADCTKKKDEPSAPPPATTSAPEAGNDVSHTPPAQMPKVEGIDVTGEKFEPEGTAFMVEELKISDSSGKVLDQFPLLDWGPVKAAVEDGKRVRVFPNGEIFQITYEPGADKKVTRTTSCKFTIPDREQKAAYKEAIASANDPNVNWETFYHVDMQEMAAGGNKYAYNFFMKPDAEAKKYLKNNDGAASIDPIVRVLKFMTENGCKW